MQRGTEGGTGRPNAYDPAAPKLSHEDLRAGITAGQKQGEWADRADETQYKKCLHYVN